ncbi:MAG: HlyD family efflux transporter periplasmic adaptor subunit [Cyclobacteriaceae bacterium]
MIRIKIFIRSFIGYTMLMVTGILFMAGCGSNGPGYDATGTFEAEETIISAEVMGVLKAFNVKEGQILKPGTLIGYIDTTSLHLQRKQLLAQIQAVLSRRPDINTQLMALREQLKAAEREQKRVQQLFDAEAATAKQLDDVNSQVAIIKGNLEATYTSLSTTSKSLVRETSPLEAQLAIIDEKINNSLLRSPMEGTVLLTYARQHEMVSPGKPLYKMADLSDITLKVYITGNQFPLVKLNQQVTVLTDDGSGGYTEQKGTIYWISDKAEFTPKSIQTQDERADKVYAMKVRVPNDGTYKIGMYGQIKFQ